MKKLHWLLFSLAVAVMWVGMAWGQDAAVKAGVTPEGVKSWFDANKTFAVFVAGLLVKYVPALVGITNAVIPWLGVAIGILMDLFAPGTAHAAGGLTSGFVLDAGSLIFQNFVQSVWARQLYEALARPVIEKLWARSPRR